MSRPVLCVPFGLVVMFLVAGPAFADPEGSEPFQPGTTVADSSIDIRIERDTAPRASATDLGVNHNVTITDRATGEPPEAPYDLYAQATNAAGERTQFFPCHHASTTDSRVSPGLYHCAIFVDHGGTWELAVVVNERKSSPEALPVTIARQTAPFQLDTDQVYRGDPEADLLQGSTTDVTLLWIHVLITGAWFLCVGAFAALGVPALRERLSSLGVYRLERRFDVLVRCTWVVTAAVTGTGIYLLAKETAYATPTSVDKLDGVFALPYGKPYFLALGIKIALYVVMVLAVLPLIRGARRHLGIRSDAGRTASRRLADRPSLARSGGSDLSRAEGALLIAPAAAPHDELEILPARSTATVWPRIALVVLVAAMAGISLCVTLLKYFHQLIEAT